MTDRSRVRMWLLPYSTNMLRVNAMRALLAHETTRDLTDMSNEAVVEAVCDLLGAGKVHIHYDALPPTPEKTRPKSEAPAPAPFTPKPPPKPMSFKLPAIDPPAFDTDVDLARQAAALVNAAAEGAPFCPI